jgi:hypothetical protein
MAQTRLIHRRRGALPDATGDATTEWLAVAARGVCNICGRDHGFDLPADQGQIDNVGNLRESLVCRGCGSISRDRALILAVAGMLGEQGPLTRWESGKDQRVLETSGYRGHPSFLAELFEYYNLPYAPPPDDDSQEPIDASAGADLQDLRFPAGYFDVIMTSDVLEHVPDGQRAIQEIARVLVPGGHLVLQVPYDHASERTFTRVYRWHGRDVHLAPPEYHAEDTLVYRNHGRELLADVSAAGLAVAHLELDLPGLAITPQSVIVATKGPYVDLSGFRVDGSIA